MKKCLRMWDTLIHKMINIVYIKSIENLCNFDTAEHALSVINVYLLGCVGVQVLYSFPHAAIKMSLWNHLLILKGNSNFIFVNIL